MLFWKVTYSNLAHLEGLSQKVLTLFWSLCLLSLLLKENHLHIISGIFDDPSIVSEVFVVSYFWTMFRESNKSLWKIEILESVMCIWIISIQKFIVIAMKNPKVFFGIFGCLFRNYSSWTWYPRRCGGILPWISDLWVPVALSREVPWSILWMYITEQRQFKRF